MPGANQAGAQAKTKKQLDRLGQKPNTEPIPALEIIMKAKNPLSGFRFFSDVAPETLETIAQKGEILGYKSGDVVFH